MHLTQKVVLPVMLLGGVAIAALYPAMPVEARSASVSQALVKRVFSASNFDLRSEFVSQAAAPLPDGKGKALVQQKCVTCHAANVWTSQHHTRDEWGSVLDNMVSKGLEASDDELDTIADYLTQNFGPVTKTALPAAPSDPATTKPPAR